MKQLLNGNANGTSDLGTVDPSERVRQSSHFVVSNATHVTVHPEAVEELAKYLAAQASSDNMGVDRWKKHDLHPKSSNEDAISWIFFVDTLNFSFWSEVEDPDSPEKFAVDYNGKRWTGYWALCAAINRAADEGVPLLNPHFYAKVKIEELSHLFRTSTKGEMPMLKERLKNLHDAGRVLLEKYDGSFVNCIRAANNNAQNLIEIVLRDFPSYRDETLFGGQGVCFYKRAQILVADVWAACEGKDLGRFEDINTVTIFPDYRIPQVLNFFGTMTYGPDLQKKLDSDYMFQYGDAEEVEIRAASVVVVELLCQRLKQILQESPGKISHVNAIVVDHFLWDYRHTHNKETKSPYHKVRCIYY